MTESKQEIFMREAFCEAKKSLKEGNKGFGAVLIKDDSTIASAHDTEISEQDSTAHAEINLIRQASKIVGKNLSGCIIVSTHEPCPMCSTAILWSGISAVVFSISINDSLKDGRKRIKIPFREIMKRAGLDIQIKQGILKEECMKLYKKDIREHVKSFLYLNPVRIDELETELLNKRKKWLDKNNKISNTLKGDDLQKAYKILCKKIGIDERDAPVVEKNCKRIVFHSKNYCPSLEACKLLDLDTREICKKIYERPADILVKSINPKLRFSRNYDKIRPYCSYCEEMILLEE